MPFTFMRLCPSCQTSIKLKSTDIGNIVKCPYCEAPLIIREKITDISKTGLPLTGEISGIDPKHIT